MPVQRAQRIDIALARCQVLHADVEVDVALDRCELLRQAQRIDVVAQALAHLALDLLAVLDDAVRRLVLVEPFRGGLGADLGNAGDVVGGIADERKVVDDLLGPHVELGLDRVAVHARVGHRVDQRHLVGDELGEVLVAGGDQHAEPLLLRRGTERADDVVGLDARDAQQRQSHRLDGVENRPHLGAQVVRHRGSCCLVLRIEVVAEGLARGVEHDGDMGWLLLAQQLEDHRQDAVQRAGRLAL